MMENVELIRINVSFYGVHLETTPMIFAINGIPMEVKLPTVAIISYRRNMLGASQSKWG
jgi:hypothetical protein